MHAIDALARPRSALGKTLGEVGVDQRLDLVLDLIGEL